MNLTAWWLLLMLVPSGMNAAKADEKVAMGLSLSSTAFKSGGENPLLHTCVGKDTSPPLAWSGIPAGTESLALIVDDPDAPNPKAPKMTWVHWVLYNIPPTATGIVAAASAATLPAGTLQGKNDWRRTGYGGPCRRPVATATSSSSMPWTGCRRPRHAHQGHARSGP